jgi:hypothetical protein
MINWLYSLGQSFSIIKSQDYSESLKLPTLGNTELKCIGVKPSQLIVTLEPQWRQFPSPPYAIAHRSAQKRPPKAM